MFYQWKVLLGFIRDVKMWSLILSVFAIIRSFLMAKKISGITRHGSGNANALMERSFKVNLKMPGILSELFFLWEQLFSACTFVY